MQDGALARNEDALTDLIASAARRRRIERFVTLGEEGYDGAADHIATHNAAVRAAKLLDWKFDQRIGILALSHTHTGTVVHEASDELRPVKKAAIAANASQWALAKAGVVPAYSLPVGDEFSAHPEFWNSADVVPYHPLIQVGETYDEVLAA